MDKSTMNQKIIQILNIVIECVINVWTNKKWMEIKGRGG